jgi:sec-independent protein translocase protein TatA
MGLGGLSLPHLLVVFVIAVLVFGTKRLQTIGTDLGGAIRNFRRAMETDEPPVDSAPTKRLESSDRADRGRDTDAS